MLYVALSGAPDASVFDQPTREGFQVRWTGWDGSQWDLYGSWGDEGGVGLTLDDIEGIGMPEFTHDFESAPGLPGGRWRGYSTEVRTVTLPLLLWHDGTSSEWVDLNRRFMRTMHPARPGSLSVRAPGGDWRSLMCRFSKGGTSLPRDPAFAGWAAYALTLAAEQPFWTGTPQRTTWEHLDPLPFIDDAGSPPFHIAAPSTDATAVVDNPGDMEAWLRWGATGPLDSLTVGIGSRTVVLDTPIPEGSTMSLDTDRRSQRIYIDGVEVYPSQRPRYAPLPDGQAVPVVVGRVGTGDVWAELTPRYMMGW